MKKYSDLNEGDSIQSQEFISFYKKTKDDYKTTINDKKYIMMLNKMSEDDRFDTLFNDFNEVELALKKDNISYSFQKLLFDFSIMYNLEYEEFISLQIRRIVES